MAIVTNLWRHPIKGVGREELNSVSLKAGKTMPWDRHWAIAHVDAKVNYDKPEWARCINFARAARGHSLMAVSSKLNETTGQITLSHPDLDDLTVNPEKTSDANALITWITKISNPDRSLPAKVYRAPSNGMTDSSSPTISIQSLASLDALSEATQTSLDQRRFRGNIWLGGMTAFEEFELVGKSVRIGQAELEIVDRIERCVATTVNPDTGISDADTLGALRSTYGHIDFGVYGIVTKSGEIKMNDQAKVI